MVIVEAGNGVRIGRGIYISPILLRVVSSRGGGVMVLIGQNLKEILTEPINTQNLNFLVKYLLHEFIVRIVPVQ